MKIEVKGNPNYCASIVEIKELLDLAGCDSICGTMIYGNHVIIGKDTPIGTVGIYFPVETKISKQFLIANNLYRDKTLNEDQTKSGFFELSGRVRAVKLRGFASEGFFIPLKSLSYISNDFSELNVGDSFDYINDILICEKYKISQTLSSTSKNEKKGKTKFSRIKVDQFRLHVDTEQLGRNIHKLSYTSLISISKKLHGTSAVFGKVLCNRPLKFYEKILIKLGVKIETTYYDSIYSSRKVIKNSDINTNATHYYSEDIWGVVNNEIKDLIPNGVTLYGEIVGYTSDNKQIQKDYDYGCDKGKHEFYVYRMTSTNIDGEVIELPMSYISAWCTKKGLKVVPELFYGCASDLYTILYEKYHMSDIKENNIVRYDKDIFLDLLSKEYLEKKCTMCVNDVPDEGVVVRVENTTDIEAYKYKSFLFKMKESKNLDNNVEDIEENQGE